MKNSFHKILLVLGCIAILANINNVYQSFFTPNAAAVIKKESRIQIQPSVLCITPYHDALPFED